MFGFNPLKSRSTHEYEQNQRVNQEVERQKQLQQKAQEDMVKLNHYIENLLKMKQIENKMYLHCANKCLSFEDKILNDKEQDCMKNCGRKIEKFVSIAKNNFKDVEDGINDSVQQYKDGLVIKQRVEERMKNM